MILAAIQTSIVGCVRQTYVGNSFDVQTNINS